MYALIGKTINSDGNNVHTWLVCVSDDIKNVVNRKTAIEKTLNKYDCFYTKNGPFVEKRNLMYNECLQIKNLLNDTQLDLGCDLVNSSGIQYVITQTTKI